MSDFREYLASQLQDSKFKAEWDALESEYQRTRATINARLRKEHSQNTLAHSAWNIQANARS